MRGEKRLTQAELGEADYSCERILRALPVDAARPSRLARAVFQHSADLLATIPCCGEERGARCTVLCVYGRDAEQSLRRRALGVRRVERGVHLRASYVMRRSANTEGAENRHGDLLRRVEVS